MFTNGKSMNLNENEIRKILLDFEMKRNTFA